MSKIADKFSIIMKLAWNLSIAMIWVSRIIATNATSIISKDFEYVPQLYRNNNQGVLFSIPQSCYESLTFVERIFTI